MAPKNRVTKKSYRLITFDTTTALYLNFSLTFLCVFGCFLFFVVLSFWLLGDKFVLILYLSLSRHFGDFLNCFAYEFTVSIFKPQIWKKNACMKIEQAPKYSLKKSSLNFFNDNHNKFTKAI